MIEERKYWYQTNGVAQINKVGFILVSSHAKLMGPNQAWLDKA